MEMHIEVNTVIEEVNKIFGKDGKNKFKTLAKNETMYSELDKLKENIENLADKSVFDELLIKENLFFGNIASFNSNSEGMIITEFGSMYTRDNLVSIKAVHGANEEMYQYEVQLESNGYLRIGWATQKCIFTESSLGVGNTPNSYGFDGFGLEKWNSSSSLPYGQKWRVGNVISCVIDFPNSTIEYFNNGRTMGKAFEDINKDGMTFFPALTVSNDELVSVNLGERPFKFPIIGAKPIIPNPTAIIDYYEKLENKINLLIDSEINLQANTKKTQKHSDKIFINKVIGNVLFHQFVLLLKIPYILDHCFISFLNYLNKKSPKKLKVLLELMWNNVIEQDMIFIMNQFMFCMLCEFKCTWRSKFDVSYQIMVLKLITAVCEETNTRKQMIANILFDKIKFAHFLHIVSPSDEMFNNMIPVVYWSIENVPLDEDKELQLTKNFPQDYKLCKSNYKDACEKIELLVFELEKLQLLFLKTLLNDNDQTDTKVSSRILFCRQFQRFVQENMIYWRNDPMLKLPGPVLLSTFFRLTCLLRELWNSELIIIEKNIDMNIFYLENYNFFGIERVGGVFSHLKTKHDEIMKSKLESFVDNQSDDQNDGNSSSVENDTTDISSLAGLLSVISRLIENTENRTANNNRLQIDVNKIFSIDHLPTNKFHILSALLNNIICLYHTAGHRQLVEYISFKERLTDLSMEYATIDNELKTSDDENKENLEKTLKDFEIKISLITRHMAWLMSMIFVSRNENVLEWILTIISYSVKYSSENEKELFEFLPEYYIDNMLGLVILLPDYTNSIQKFDNIIVDKKWLALLIGETLLQIFGDDRIVHPESKESIVQGVTLYLTNPNSVEVLQEVSEKSRLHAIKSILKSNDRNIWIKTNTILMLIWHGSGFAFRYRRPPHLENQNISINRSIEEIVFSNLGVERPVANVLQNDIRTLIAENKDMALNFINNSLNFLNWSFSEFISLFQEIKDINGDDGYYLSPEELSKLKVCSRSFIFTVIVLRVIEMMINFDRSLVTDQEGSLNRVFQLICQILNRVNFSTSTFQHFLRSTLPFVECIHKFAILGATVGVLLALLCDEIDEKDENISDSRNKISSIPNITDIFISDPNFNLSSLDFVILPENDTEVPFTLNSYKKYVTEEELKKIAVMYKHLEWYMKRHKSMASSINEDDLCVICYSNKNNVILRPCEHQCCKLCINHHILYSHVCFYCKRRIELIEDINSSVILHNFGSEPPPL